MDPSQPVTAMISLVWQRGSDRATEASLREKELGFQGKEVMDSMEESENRLMANVITLGLWERADRDRWDMALLSKGKPWAQPSNCTAMGQCLGMHGTPRSDTRTSTGERRTARGSWHPFYR